MKYINKNINKDLPEAQVTVYSCSHCHMFWWHHGNVEGKRLVVVCMKGMFDVCLFVADGWLIFFSPSANFELSRNSV